MKDFSTENLRQWFASKLSFISILSLTVFATLLVFFAARTVSESSLVQLATTVESILRIEGHGANTYELAKSISDLESLKLIDCAQLRESGGPGRLFYDTTMLPNCSIHDFTRKFRAIKVVEIRAMNGQSFVVTLQAHRRWTDFLLEFFGYLIVFAGGYSLEVARKQLAEKSQRRVQLVKLEKDLLLESNRQVKHDVSSPLTAIRIVVGLLKNVDPKQREVLSKAITRAEEIFNHLSNTNDASTNLRIHAERAIQEIVAEKTAIWGDQVKFEFKGKSLKEVFLIGNEMEFKRILSNLLNNAFEAKKPDQRADLQFSFKEAGDYFSIVVQDFGRGMRESLVSRLGVEPVSFGKEGVSGAGAGIGVYSSAQKVRSWSGTLEFRSREGHGTEVEVKLLKTA